MQDIKTIKAPFVEVISPLDNNRSVKVFHGFEGVKKVYLDTLTTPKGESIYAFLNNEVTPPELHKWLSEEYSVLRAKKGIFAHVFVTNDPKSPKSIRYKSNDQKKNRQTHFVESFGYDYECEINIYHNKVAFINHNPLEKAVGIIIQNPVIFNTLKSFYLHYLWRQ